MLPKPRLDWRFVLYPLSLSQVVSPDFLSLESLRHFVISITIAVVVLAVTVVIIVATAVVVAVAAAAPADTVGYSCSFY